MTAPLYEHLRQYASQKRISFAMPGHKNGRGIKRDFLSLDVTELPVTENLYHGGEHVKNANALLSRFYGSDESIILTGGSTAAIQAMICGTVKRGGTLLCDAQCHQSVINACTLAGIKIRLIPVEIEADFGIGAGIKSVSEYISADIDAVIITSPNYYGICSDIRQIAMECHANGIPLLVDEAHGAHFAAYSGFPVTAVQYADAVCHSAHKTLNALNGAAYLHMNGSLIDFGRIKRALTMFASSSPSYVIAASADTARSELESGKDWENIFEMCKSFRSAAAKTGIKVLPNDDATRLVLNFSEFYITGFEVERILSQSGIDIEMADLFNIVLIITPSNTREDMRALWWVLLSIAESAPKRETSVTVFPPPVCGDTLSPADAFNAVQEKIEIEKSAGRISCGTVVPYPPGVPVIFTGERIRKEQLEYIDHIITAGGKVNGIEGGKISVIK